MTSLFEQVKGSIVTADSETLETLIPLFRAKHSIDEMFQGVVYPALDTLCHRLQERTLAIPDLLMGLKAVHLLLEKTKAHGFSPMRDRCIVLGVIEGDTHDMGKNIIRDLYTGYGYRVVDLGKNVSIETFTERAVAENADVVGISTMMSTTLTRVKEAVASLKRARPTIKVMTGGAFLNAKISADIHADGYAESAATLMANTELLFS